MGNCIQTNQGSSQILEQSFLKRNADLGTFLQLLSKKFQVINNNLANSNLNSNDVRFEAIKIPIPQLSQDPLARKNLTEKFLGQIFKVVIERGFGLLKIDELDNKKTKIYCSQKIIGLLVKFIRKNKLDSKDVQYMQQCIKNKILPYIASKYPLSESQRASSSLSRNIVVRDNSADQKNDMINISKINFKYKKSGNYNKEIMEFFNYIIEQSKFLEEDFSSEIMGTFTRIQSLQKTQKMLAFNPKTLRVEQKKKLSKAQSPDFDLDIEYSQKIRGFTEYLTAKKLPDGLKKFSKRQIQQQTMQISNPALMRVTTKWCEHLQKYFKPGAITERDKPFRMKNGQMKYLRQRWMAYILESLLQKAYLQHPKKYLERVQKHRYESQSTFSQQAVEEDMINMYSQQEALVGSFASKIFSLNGDYFEGYLNSLIHGILSAVKQFQKVIVCQMNRKNLTQQIKFFVEDQTQQNLDKILKKIEEEEKKGEIVDQNKTIELYSPELITFKIFDLLRSRCYSKEEQIHALYCQFQKISHQNPEKYKIVKVKDRLNKDTKDINIHMLYKKKILVEVQLAIRQDSSKFISSSNKIQHFLYELLRSQFGPINQMCCIWSSYDGRAKYYQSQIHNRNFRKQNNKLYKKCKHKNTEKIILPFKCSNCYYFYSQCPKGGNHISCSDCAGQICFLCQIHKFSVDQKIQALQLKQFVENKGKNPNQILYQKGENSQILQNLPSQGYIVNIKSSVRKITKYFKYHYQNKIYLLEQVQGQKNFKKIISFIDHQKNKSGYSEEFINNNLFKIRKFFIQNVVLSFKSEDLSQKQMRQKNLDIRKHFIVQEYLLNSQNALKDTIVLVGEDLDSSTFEQWKRTRIQMEAEKLQNIKELNLSENNIEDIQVIVEEFPQLERLYMWNNKLKNLSKIISSWKNMRILEFRDNQIQNVPSSLGQLKNLTRLSFSNNRLDCFPQEICKLQSLQSLDLKKNGLTKIPSSIGNLKNLTNLYIRENQFTSVPDTIDGLESLYWFVLMENKLTTIPSSIGNLKKLYGIAVSTNLITSLPSSIGDLPELQELWLQDNLLKELPESICKLQKLRILKVYKNRLQKLPQKIGNLKKLKQLRCDGNKLKSLPQSLQNLQQLQILKVHDNQIKFLPKNIGHCISLKELSIENNPIKQLPDSLYELSLDQLRIGKDLNEKINSKLMLKNKNLEWKII